MIEGWREERSHNPQWSLQVDTVVEMWGGGGGGGGE